MGRGKVWKRKRKFPTLVTQIVGLRKKNASTKTFMKWPWDLGGGLRMHEKCPGAIPLPQSPAFLRSPNYPRWPIQLGLYAFRRIIVDGLLMQPSFIMACFSLLYHAGIFILESVPFILPAEVGSEIDFKFYKLRGWEIANVIYHGEGKPGFNWVSQWRLRVTKLPSCRLCSPVF